jgi:hypothetical protein
LANSLAAAAEILKNHDQVVFDALAQASTKLPFRENSDLVAAVFEFEQVAREAASIEGQSGNRPHPTWMHEATARCRSFWADQMQAEAVGYFNAQKKPKRGQSISHSNEPANAFSRWFCDVMHEFAGLRTHQCDTLLRHKSAF